MSRASNTAAPITRSNRRNSLSPKMLETLEARQLYSVTPSIDYPSFSSLAGLVTNGYGSQTALQTGKLVLTDATLTGEARSVWSDTTVGIDKFTTHFSYEVSSLIDTSGFTFTLQNSDMSAVGEGGDGLGYQGIGHSVAIAFNIGNGLTAEPTYGVFTNGQQPATNNPLGSLDLRVGDVVHVTVSYDGGNLNVAVNDPNSSIDSFNGTTAINLPALLGGDKAIAGFTAGSGLSLASQMLESWDFTGWSHPTIVDPAMSLTSTVEGKTADLDVLGADDNGESNLIYTWTVAQAPHGAKPVTFGANATNAAKASTVRFYKAGTYVFNLTVTNLAGLSVSDTCQVVVQQTAKSLRMSPHQVVIKANRSERFAATALDQFGHPMRVQPAIKYAIVTGRGTIAESKGLFTAPSLAEHVVVSAKTALDDLLGTVGATVVS
jgi:hypothetical protein